MTDHKRYFIKCENCGFLTEILNENQSWCYNCTKRFTNYYKAWQPAKGKKDLDSYKNSICIPYSDVDIKQNNKKAEITQLDRGGHNVWDFRQL